MPLFLYPLIVLASTQLLKLFFESRHGNFSWNHLLSNGGMPSSHSAFAASIATISYLTAGLNSLSFAIALSFAMVIIWDAFTTRWQLGYHGNILNKLIKELPDKQEYKYPLLNERLGHTIKEVMAGTLWGIVFSLMLWLL
ncbi:MAG: divergent PAP2 family protein [Candidatus Komeilibacteria bacterium]